MEAGKQGETFLSTIENRQIDSFVITAFMA
jgi:hypothetical protein